jgi:manganese/zinc/iron transport system ATP- binding protein
MQQEGKTVLVVHHDLTTAPSYFDHLLMLNLRLVAFGAVEKVWTPECLQLTYGGQATMLSEVAFKRSVKK